jgi:hypothetical protein
MNREEVKQARRARSLTLLVAVLRQSQTNEDEPRSRRFYPRPPIFGSRKWELNLDAAAFGTRPSAFVGKNSETGAGNSNTKGGWKLFHAHGGWTNSQSLRVR